MSEEKLYAVKNDEGKYLLMDITPLWGYKEGSFVKNSALALAWADDQGGHVVTFVEEPKKVVLTKEQAKIVEDARDGHHPASVLRFSGKDDEELLMNAYVNGYTVAKEKKYNVKVPHTKEVWYYKASEAYLLTICPADKKLRGEFTEAEIEHYGLQDCEKVECDNDD